MRIQAPAKINLRLEVVGRREDGYHLLHSVMAPISLADELEFTLHKASGIHLTCDNPSLSVGPDNLVMKAALAVLSHTGSDAGVRIHLIKKIPMAAGLGGGSSDAASTLLAINDLLQLNLGIEVLHNIAVSLGADVPFFLMKCACLAQGIGERLTLFKVPKGLPLTLVKPSAGLSAAQVYRELHLPLTHSVKPINLPASFDDGPAVCTWLRNDLETPALRLIPEIQNCKNLLLDSGACGALMSGSGTTVFGIFKHPGDAVAACEKARANGYWSQPCALV